MHELIIIGAGPIGLFAAYYAGMRNINTLVLEARSTYGGQPKLLYPQKIIYDIPAIPSITGEELVESLYQQYATFADQIPIHYNVKIDKIKKIDEGFEVIAGDTSYFCKCILSCTGNGDFKPIKLPLADADKCHNITYRLGDTSRFAGLDVVILGGGDSAVDFANLIVDKTKSTTIVHRRNEFRAHEDSLNTFLASPKGRVKANKTLLKLNHHENKAKSFHLLDNHTQQEEVIEFDHCIVSYGLLPSKHPLSSLVHIEEQGIIVKPNMESSLKGVFAIGNSAYYLGKSKTLAVGFGEAITAISAIHQLLYPSKNPQFFSSVSFKKEC